MQTNAIILYPNKRMITGQEHAVPECPSGRQCVLETNELVELFNAGTQFDTERDRLLHFKAQLPATFSQLNQQGNRDKP